MIQQPKHQTISPEIFENRSRSPPLLQYRWGGPSAQPGRQAPTAAAVLFALYTATPWDAGQPKPRAAIIAALTGVLAERAEPPHEQVWDKTGC
jgi:hypothetical protein